MARRPGRPGKPFNPVTAAAGAARARANPKAVAKEALSRASGRAEDDAINPKTLRPMSDQRAARKAGLREGSGYGKGSPNGSVPGKARRRAVSMARGMK